MSERKQSRLTASGWRTLPRRPCLDDGLVWRSVAAAYMQMSALHQPRSLSLALGISHSVSRVGRSRSRSLFAFRYRRWRAAFFFVVFFCLLLLSLQPLPRGEDAEMIDGRGMRFVWSLSGPETVARASHAWDRRARRCVVATSRALQTFGRGENET